MVVCIPVIMITTVLLLSASRSVLISHISAIMKFRNLNIVLHPQDGKTRISRLHVQTISRMLKEDRIQSMLFSKHFGSISQSYFACDYRTWQTSKSWSQWVSALWRGSRWLHARLCATSRACQKQKWKKSKKLQGKCWWNRIPLCDLLKTCNSS